MEIALGCITTIFGSRAAQRIAILMNLYGLKLNQDKVLQASIFLKPKARMISLRYVSKYHKFCIEDSTEGELFFDVKKLMTRGDLTPILFGSKVTFVYISRLTWAVTWWRNTVGDKEEALELWIIIPSYSDSRFGVFLEFFVTPNFQSWAEVVRCWPIKSARHTQTSQSESTFREAFSDLNTLPFFSTPPSLHNSCFPIQYTLTSIFSNERPLVDLNFFRKRNEPKTSNRFQLLKFKSHVGFTLRVYMCLYQF